VSQRIGEVGAVLVWAGGRQFTVDGDRLLLGSQGVVQLASLREPDAEVDQ
jgi:hypothetical protein